MGYVPYNPFFTMLSQSCNSIWKRYTFDTMLDWDKVVISLRDRFLKGWPTELNQHVDNGKANRLYEKIAAYCWFDLAHNPDATPWPVATWSRPLSMKSCEEKEAVISEAYAKAWEEHNKKIARDAISEAMKSPAELAYREERRQKKAADKEADKELKKAMKAAGIKIPKKLSHEEEYTCIMAMVALLSDGKSRTAEQIHASIEGTLEDIERRLGDSRFRNRGNKWSLKPDPEMMRRAEIEAGIKAITAALKEKPFSTTAEIRSITGMSSKIHGECIYKDMFGKRHRGGPDGPLEFWLKN